MRLDLLLHERHAALAADQDDLRDVARPQPLVAQDLVANLERARDQVCRELVELLAAERHAQVDGLALLLLDEVELDDDVGDERQVDLRRLGSVLDALHGDGVLRQVEPVLALELLQHVVDDPVVEIHAAQEGVAAGGCHLEHVAVELQDAHVEGAAAQVVDEDPLVEAAVEAVGERRGGGLVDDAPDVEAGQRPGLLHGLPLVVVVIRGNGDDGVRHRPAQELLGNGLDVRQDERADLRERVRLAAQHHPCRAVGTLDDLIGIVGPKVLHHLRLELAADEPLGAVDGVPGVRHHLVFGHAADEEVALVGQRHDRREDEVPALGRHDLRNAVPHVGDAGVRRPEVDPDDAWLIGHFARCRGPSPAREFLTRNERGRKNAAAPPTAYRPASNRPRRGSILA